MLVQAIGPVNARNPSLLNVAYRREQFSFWGLAFIADGLGLFTLTKPCATCTGTVWKWSSAVTLSILLMI